MNKDIIDIIFKSELLQKGVTFIKDLIAGFIPNDFVYFLFWVGVSVALGFYLSGKLISKTVHIITLAILIFFVFKYIGLV